MPILHFDEPVILPYKNAQSSDGQVRKYTDYQLVLLDYLTGEMGYGP